MAAMMSSGGGGGEVIPPEPEPISLPEGYTECDYIQNANGKAYINVGTFSGYGFKSTFRIATKIQYDVDSCSNEWPALFGVRQSTTSGSAVRFEAFGYKNSNGYEFGVAVGGASFGTAYRTKNGQPHTMDLSQSRLIYDGTTYPNTNQSPWSWTTTCRFLIGALNNTTGSGANNNGLSPSGGSGGAEGAKFFYFKIYDGDTLARDYVPCYNTTTQKYGFYDLVNENFVSSASSSEFTGQIKQND